MGLGIQAARETIDGAAAKVTASADSIARSIAAAIGLSVGAVLIAAVALILSAHGHRAAAA